MPTCLLFLRVEGSMMELGGVALATLIFAILAVYLYRSSRVKGVEGLQVVYEDAAPEVE